MLIAWFTLDSATIRMWTLMTVLVRMTCYMPVQRMLQSATKANETRQDVNETPAVGEQAMVSVPLTRPLSKTFSTQKLIYKVNY